MNIKKLENIDDLNFGELNHGDALRVVIQRMENGESLSFAEQCVLFMVVLAQCPSVMTRESIDTIKGNTEVWGEIQPLVSQIAESFPTQWQMTLSEFGAVACGLNLDGSERERNINDTRKPLVCKTYIVRKIGTTEVKIGKSIRVEKRIRTLETQSGANLEVLAVIPKDIENMLHRQFMDLRTVGEWFDDSKGLIAAFAAKQGVAA